MWFSRKEPSTPRVGELPGLRKQVEDSAFVPKELPVTTSSSITLDPDKDGGDMFRGFGGGRGGDAGRGRGPGRGPGRGLGRGMSSIARPGRGPGRGLGLSRSGLPAAGSKLAGLISEVGDLSDEESTVNKDKDDDFEFTPKELPVTESKPLSLSLDNDDDAGEGLQRGFASKSPVPSSSRDELSDKSSDKSSDNGSLPDSPTNSQQQEDDSERSGDLDASAGSGLGDSVGSQSRRSGLSESYRLDEPNSPDPVQGSDSSFVPSDNSQSRYSRDSRSVLSQSQQSLSIAPSEASSPHYGTSPASSAGSADYTQRSGSFSRDSRDLSNEDSLSSRGNSVPMEVSARDSDPESPIENLHQSFDQSFASDGYSAKSQDELSYQSEQSPSEERTFYDESQRSISDSNGSDGNPNDSSRMGGSDVSSASDRSSVSRDDRRPRMLQRAGISKDEGHSSINSRASSRASSSSEKRPDRNDRRGLVKSASTLSDDNSAEDSENERSKPEGDDQPNRMAGARKGRPQWGRSAQSLTQRPKLDQAIHDMYDKNEEQPFQPDELHDPAPDGTATSLSDGSGRNSYLSEPESESSSEYETDTDEEEPPSDTPRITEDSDFKLSLRGVALENVESWFLSYSDPFFQISAFMNVPGSVIWQPIFRSEEILNNLNPVWKECTINLDLLCGLDLEQPILISIFDWEKNGKHQPMGFFETSVNKLLDAVVGNSEPPDTSKAFTSFHEGKDYGKIVVVDARIETPPPENPEPVVKQKKMRKKKKKKPETSTDFQTHSADSNKPSTQGSDAVESIEPSRFSKGVESTVDQNEHFEGATSEGQNRGRVGGPSNMGDSSSKSAKKNKKEKSAAHMKKQRKPKFNHAGDEVSVGTIEYDDLDDSRQDRSNLDDTRDLSGDTYETGSALLRRPWKDSLPSMTKETTSGEGGELSGFTFHGGNLNPEDRFEDKFETVEENVGEQALESSLHSAHGNDSFAASDVGSNKSVEDFALLQHNEMVETTDELNAMTSMEQSFNQLNGAVGSTLEYEGNKEMSNFDEFWDNVECDEKLVAEFQKKVNERERRNRKRASKRDDDNDDVDLLRDTPRLKLFESEVDWKKKDKRKTRGKKSGTAQFSKEFVAAIHQIFNEESEDDNSSDDEKHRRSKSYLAQTVDGDASVTSLFINSAVDVGNETQDHRLDVIGEDPGENGNGSDDGGDGKSQKSSRSNRSKESRTSSRSGHSRRSRRMKKPKVDPAIIFEQELKRQQNQKIMSTDGLKQEMADMRRGIRRDMMERELANLKRATASDKNSSTPASNNFSPFEDSTNTGGNAFDEGTSKPFGAPGSRAKTGGLMSHLAKHKGDKGGNKLDDLATIVQHSVDGRGKGGISLDDLPDLPGVMLAKKVRNKMGNALPAIEETNGASPFGGEQAFFASNEAWDDNPDEQSEAAMGLTGGRLEDEPKGPRAGLTRKLSFALPKLHFSFRDKKKDKEGDKKGGFLSDDGDGGGIYSSSDY